MLKPLESWTGEVVTAKGLVLLEFKAPWCKPCKVIEPLLEKSNVQTFTVDVDTNPDMVNQFGISSVPTLIAFVDGKEVARGFGSNALEMLRNSNVAI